jgi:hypothetical protein
MATAKKLHTSTTTKKLPTMPSIDLSGFDASMLADLDSKVLDFARDAAYVTIGIGVLTAQKAQVMRRELTAQMHEKMNGMKNDTTFEDQMAKLQARLDDLDASLDSAVEKIEAKLPTPAANLVGQAHDAAKAARKQVRGLVRSAA